MTYRNFKLSFSCFFGWKPSSHTVCLKTLGESSNPTTMAMSSYLCFLYSATVRHAHPNPSSTAGCRAAASVLRLSLRDVSRHRTERRQLVCFANAQPQVACKMEVCVCSAFFRATLLYSYIKETLYTTTHIVIVQSCSLIKRTLSSN